MDEKKEKEYQAVIDELHREINEYKTQIEELKVKLLQSQFEADIYKDAILKSFIKWSDTDANK